MHANQGPLSLLPLIESQFFFKVKICPLVNEKRKDLSSSYQSPVVFQSLIVYPPIINPSFP